MNPKPIDCVKMKNEIQQQIYEEIRTLTPDQQLTYFRDASRGSSPLAVKFRRLAPAIAPEQLPTDETA